VLAAKHLALVLDAVADNPATTVGAQRRQGVDSALKRIERVVGPLGGHCERLVVIIPADFANCHDPPPATYRAFVRGHAGIAVSN
jgi:hypothetical protein